METTRRQFVARAGGAAATVLVPHALARRWPRRDPAVQGRPLLGRRRLGRPDARGRSRCGRASTRRRRRDRPVELEVATDKNFRHVVARKRRRPARPSTTRQGARHRPQGPRGVLLPLRHRRPTAPSAASAPRCRPTPAAGDVRVLLLPGLHARLLQRARRDGRRATSTSSSASATTSTTRPTTRSRTAPASATTRSARENPQQPGHRPRGRHARPTTATSTRSTAPTRRCARCTRKFPMVMLWDDHEVQDNYAGEPAGRRPAARQALHLAAQEGRPTGLLRDMPAFAERRRTALPQARLRRQRRPHRHGPAPATATTSPATTRSSPPCADYDQPRDFLGRAQMNWVKSALGLLEGRLEGDGQRGDDHADARARRRQLHLRHLARLPAGARGAADPHPRQADQGRGLRHRRHPHVHRRRRAHRRRTTGDTVATEFVGGSITSQSLGETTLDAGGGVDDPGQRREPGDAARADRRAARASTRRSTTPTSTTTASARSPPRPTASTCELVRMETIKKKSTKKLPSTRLDLPASPRARRRSRAQRPARA